MLIDRCLNVGSIVDPLILSSFLVNASAQLHVMNVLWLYQLYVLSRRLWHDDSVWSWRLHQSKGTFAARMKVHNFELWLNSCVYSKHQFHLVCHLISWSAASSDPWERWVRVQVNSIHLFSLKGEPLHQRQIFRVLWHGKLRIHLLSRAKTVLIGVFCSALHSSKFHCLTALSRISGSQFRFEPHR